MSSINYPIFKGQKTVFFHCFLTQFPSSNHNILWSNPVISSPNHNTSSELYSQRAWSCLDSYQIPCSEHVFYQGSYLETYPLLAFVCGKISIIISTMMAGRGFCYSALFPPRRYESLSFHLTLPSL